MREGAGEGGDGARTAAGFGGEEFEAGEAEVEEYVDQYIDSAADRLSVYHHTGRQYYFGARFKF